MIFFNLTKLISIYKDNTFQILFNIDKYKGDSFITDKGRSFLMHSKINSKEKLDCLRLIAKRNYWDYLLHKKTTLSLDLVEPKYLYIIKDNSLINIINNDIVFIFE